MFGDALTGAPGCGWVSSPKPIDETIPGSSLT